MGKPLLISSADFVKPNWRELVETDRVDDDDRDTRTPEQIDADRLAKMRARGPEAYRQFLIEEIARARFNINLQLPDNCGINDEWPHYVEQNRAKVEAYTLELAKASNVLPLRPPAQGKLL